MIDYKSLIMALRALNDNDTEDVAAKLSAVFDEEERRPPELPSIDDTVIDHFPTPFAKTFVSWRKNEGRFLRDLPNDDDALDDLPDDVASDKNGFFKLAFGDIFTLWKQIVHFLPFLLMQSIARVQLETIREYASEPFYDSVKYYRAFYERYTNDPNNMKKEADQRQLLSHLLRSLSRTRYTRCSARRIFLHAATRRKESIRAIYTGAL